MPPHVITPETPCVLIGLRPSRAGHRQGYFWIGYTTDNALSYRDRMVEIAREDGIGSAALKAAIRAVLASGDGVDFDQLMWNFPRREAAEKKMAAIEHFLAEGHPLCNSEVQKIAHAKERAARAEARAAHVAEREERERIRRERQREYAAAHERKMREKELYGWPDAPEGCMNIYAEEEWAPGAEPRVVRVASTKNSAATTNRIIGYTMLAHPFTPQAQRVRDQKARGVRRRLRLLEVHPRAGLKERKDAWAQQLGV